MRKPEIHHKLSNMEFHSGKNTEMEYENTAFVNCTFTDVSGIRFTECFFDTCNLSNCRSDSSSFQECEFKGSKLSGMHFENCSPLLFEVEFNQCILNNSSFYGMKLKKMRFDHCNLAETDFTKTDLSQSVFNDCDLMNSKFDNSNLNQADFSSAYNYNIDINTCNVKKAKFSLQGLPGLLNGYGIEITQ